ncbi:hypothetical protein [Ferruginibacter sp. SUN106]|uniref:hypothetical protein n=1 Tax=Ferruginibacter sp. SUN106 TaxID=2978348 RepID=UPI003D36DB46
MYRSLLTLVLLFSFCFLFAQDKTTIIHTDSSVIESVCKAGSYKIVEERFEKGNRILSTSYFDDTLTIKNISYHDTLGNFIGVQKIFDKNGKLILTIDHDRLTWNADTDVYPNYPLLVRVKARADSVLRIYFGKQFTATSMRWNIFNSCYFAGNSGSPNFDISWTREDYPSYKPTICYITYDIVNGNEWRGKLRMLIDTSGNIQDSQLIQTGDILYNEGFKQFTNNEQPFYKLSIKQALEKAKALGLKKGDDLITSTSYEWETNKNSVSPIFNGNVRLIISQSRKSDFKFVGDVGFWTGYTNIWVFDPWSGDFIKRRKIRNN